MSHRVLVVDDEEYWIENYEDILEPEGYEVRGSDTMQGALELAASWLPHVIIVDQKLEGPGGRDLGLSLIGRLAAQNPASRILLVTGYATNEAVIRAFSAGATDYLEKTAILAALLRHKVAQAAIVAEQAMGGISAEEHEQALQREWTSARTVTQPQRKGKHLEQAVKLLFQSIPGFFHARTNVRNPTEEIDVIVTNRSTDPLLSRQGDFVIVECKNWSGVVGTPVTSRLSDKVSKRYGRAKLGICVALGGFASTVAEDLRAERRGDVLILLMDADAIQSWIDADDRQGWLIKQLEDAIV